MECVRRAALYLGVMNIRNHIVGLAYLSLRWVASIPSHRLRNLLLRYVYGLKLDAKAILHKGFRLRKPSQIHIGAGSVIGEKCELDGRKGLYIGKNVNVSSEVLFYTLQHDTQDPTFGTVGAPIYVEDFSWISVRAIVLPGVTIGEGAVVAAGAVVVSNVEPYTIVAGIPAKVMGTRPSSLDYCPADYVLPFH